jgi:hypothetical protein|uniref:Uncharacterized protein n=1 Tax=Picea glauca TaxID=3330 RepID=A0A101M4M4_PICGL|nr:hypothetical protein ABT39_MTgene643 [Picea glauca]QHR87028.1 hypothetical protein Q903MT_gene1037 [Picea sitchensis]
MVHGDYEKLPSCGHLSGILLPILSFLWLAIGRRNNIFRQETLPLIHFCLLQHTSQEDAFTQNEHLDDSSFASLVSQLLPLKQLLNRLSQVPLLGKLPLFQ